MTDDDVIEAIVRGVNATSDLARMFSRTPSALQQRLARLERQGRVLRVGAGTWTRWMVAVPSRGASPLTLAARRERLDREIVEVRAYLDLLVRMREGLGGA